ncbi:MAG: stage II sporulation protein P [Coprobacillus cateniformis]
MNNNLKIVLKVIVVVVILLNLPFQKVYSENVENIVSSLTTTDVKKQSNGKSIYIYNTHQGEKYASNSVKEGSKYLMQLLEQRGYSVDYETTDFELYKMKNHIDYAYSYTVSKKYLNNALKDHGGYDLVIDFHRDSIKKSLSTITVDNKNYAKLMFVVGKGSGNYPAVNKCCEKLSSMINKKIPKLSRGFMLKQSHYNQGVTKNMVLIEVGANENTYEEVQNSLNILALVLDEYLSA